MSSIIKKRSFSLRNWITFLFLLISIVPVALLSWYAASQIRNTFDLEITERIKSNKRELQLVFQETERLALQRLDAVQFILSESITSASLTPLRAVISRYPVKLNSQFNLYDSQGVWVGGFQLQPESEISYDFGSSQQRVSLQRSLIDRLVNEAEVYAIEQVDPSVLNLAILRNLKKNSGFSLGYIEELIKIDEAQLKKLEQQMGVTLLLSRSDIKKLSSFDESNFIIKTDSIFWGGFEIPFVFAAPRKFAQAALDHMAFVFYVFSFGLLMALIGLALWMGKILFQPFHELIRTIQRIQSQDLWIPIPMGPYKELNLIIERLNELGLAIFTTRRELKDKVAELQAQHRELQETQAQLVQSSKMASLGQLVAGVAHELNNPIGFIYSNMAHLKEYTDKLLRLSKKIQQMNLPIAEIKDLDLNYLQEDLPKLISSCEEGARRTRDIVLGLRNFSRQGEGEFRPFDVIEGLEASLGLLQNQTKDLVTVHRLYSQVPKVWAHPGQINQVFLNLLSNALQALEGKTGQIWVATEVIKKSVGTRSEEGFVKVSIQDSGVGIKPEHLEKIFDPFFTTKDVGQGTGLGLSISYGIVQRHGGEITVRSELGKGSEFSVLLPISKENPERSN